MKSLSVEGVDQDAIQNADVPETPTQKETRILDFVL